MIWVILGVIQSILNAFWMILTKKVLENKKVWNNIQTFLNRSYHFLILLLLFILWFLNYNIDSAWLTYWDYWLFFISTSMLYVTYPLRRVAYANEKVSVLQPYAMLFQVFPVIIWFIFISSERTNLITFLSAVLAALIVILSSIDYKNFKFNKYSLMVLLSSLIKSIQVFATLYFLKKLTPASLYFTESILIIFISLFLMYFKNEFNQFKLLKKNYIKLLTFANSVVLISILLALTMYSSLGVILTSLLSLLYLAFIYILGYFILWEKPSKKDILVTLAVACCIIIWVLAKN